MSQATTIHDQLYEFYSWQDLGRDQFELAKKIITQGLEFDRVVALAKGGLTFSRTITDFLGVDQLSSIQIELYTGIGTTTKTPVITQSLPVSIKNERILILDDIVDRGETMIMATEYLKQHGPTSIHTAALMKKPWAIFEVDFFSRETEAWVIFPHEIREMIETLAKLWQTKGDSPEVIKEQLAKIGFSEDEVALFYIPE